MEKRGQFYLIAIILIVTVLLGFLTATNYLKKEKSFPLSVTEEEINLEKENLLDYISSQQKSPSETYNLIVNFSREFQNKIGSDKDVIFIFGNETNITILGNIQTETFLEYKIGASFVNITNPGSFIENLGSSNSNIEIRIDGDSRNYYLYNGQNIYYLIKYTYNEEVYIIHG
ncbi:MAG: hypothetical protein U9Q99_01860 [Nanoarchaeota archaeon]|nr:hypothetical protein [Nanoarchaeota archaeon]